jgi:hypothetical protein
LRDKKNIFAEVTWLSRKINIMTFNRRPENCTHFTFDIRPAKSYFIFKLCDGEGSLTPENMSGCSEDKVLSSWGSPTNRAAVIQQSQKESVWCVKECAVYQLQ